jgi:NDP-sugar pyrophosphorylase family protein
MIKGVNLTNSIAHIYNDNPIVAHEGYLAKEIKELMLAHRLECIPVIDSQKRVVNVLVWDSIFSGKKSKENIKLDIPVVIMAGGKGARLDPFTRILPKPLIPIGKKPIIEIIMDNFAKTGCHKFYLTVNYKGEMIKSYFDNTDSGYKVRYIWEKKYLGTAGSLRLLPDDFAQTFFVTNCDVIVKTDYLDMLSFHKENRNAMTMVGSVQHYEIPYGVLKIKNGGRLKCINEKPEYDFIVNAGLYIIEKEILTHIPKNKFCDITDFIATLHKNNLKIGVYPVSQNSYIDIGEWKKYQNTLNNIAEKLDV